MEVVFGRDGRHRWGGLLNGRLYALSPVSDDQLRESDLSRHDPTECEPGDTQLTEAFDPRGREIAERDLETPFDGRGDVLEWILQHERDYAGLTPLQEELGAHLRSVGYPGYEHFGEDDEEGPG